jgi:hypothetical protein
MLRQIGMYPPRISLLELQRPVDGLCLALLKTELFRYSRHLIPSQSSS